MEVLSILSFYGAKALSHLDFSVLYMPETCLLTFLVFAAILRKRGTLHAFMVVVLCSVVVSFIWNEMATSNQMFWHAYIAALVCLSGMVVLYLVYLYALQNQID